jgi:tetratricopeptide (TPR) repeat protein
MPAINHVAAKRAGNLHVCGGVPAAWIPLWAEVPMSPFWRVLGVGLLWVATACGIDVPGPKPLTAAQQERLKERDRYGAEARSLRAAGKLAEAVAAAEKKLAIEREVFGERHADVVGSLQLLAGLHQKREDWPAARTARQEVLRLQTALHGAADWRVTDARQQLADLERWIQWSPEERIRLREASRLNTQVGQLWQAGRSREALPLAQQVVQLLKELLGENDPLYAQGLSSLAAQHAALQHAGEAEQLYRRVLAIRKQALGERHPDYALGLHNLAGLYQRQRDYVRAEPLYHQALALYKAAAGEHHPGYAQTLHNLAALYQAQGDYGKAEPLYQQALALRKEVLGERHADYAITLDSLAGLYLGQGDYARAEPLFQQALAIHKQALGERHHLYATSLNNLGLLYLAQGDYAKAEPLLQRVLATYKQAGGERDPRYSTSLHNLAWLYQKQGDYVRAEPLIRQALAIQKQALGERHPDYATSLNNLGLLYKAQGDYARAEPLLRQALAIQKPGAGGAPPLLRDYPEQPGGTVYATGGLRQGRAALPGGFGRPQRDSR